MNLEMRIIFTYNIDDHHNGIGEGTSFTTIDEVKKILRMSRDYYQTPYHLNIGRSVQISDADALKHQASVPQQFFGNYHGAPLQSVTVGSEGIDLIVTDKLIYPQDVRKMLTEKYGNVLDFDTNKKWNEKQPVYFSGVTSNTQYGLHDSKTGAPTSYTIHSVNCRELSDTDIVINTNMNQIWPIKTNKMPTLLTELLARTTQNITQR